MLHGVGTSSTLCPAEEENRGTPNAVTRAKRTTQSHVFFAIGATLSRTPAEKVRPFGSSPLDVSVCGLVKGFSITPILPSFRYPPLLDSLHSASTIQSHCPCHCLQSDYLDVREIKIRQVLIFCSTDEKTSGLKTHKCGKQQPCEEAHVCANRTGTEPADTNASESDDPVCERFRRTKENADDRVTPPTPCGNTSPYASRHTHVR